MLTICQIMFQTPLWHWFQIIQIIPSKTSTTVFLVKILYDWSRVRDGYTRKREGNGENDRSEWIGLTSARFSCHDKMHHQLKDGFFVLIFYLMDKNAFYQLEEQNMTYISQWKRVSFNFMTLTILFSGTKHAWNTCGLL